MNDKNQILDSLIQLNDFNPDLIMICDVKDIENFKIIYVNKKMADSFKSKKNKLIGKNFWDIVPEKIVKIRKKQALQVIKTKKPVIFEDERFGRYFSNLYIPIFDKNNEVVYGATITKEITEKKLSELKYQDIVDNINEGIFSLDEKGFFTYVNKIMEKRSGFTKEEFYKMNFYDIVLPEYRNKLKEQYNSLLQGKKVKPMEIKYKNKKGELIFISISANLMYKNNKVIGVNGLTRDITDAKLKEIELKNSEKRWRSLVENIPDEDRITIIDKDYKILFINRVNQFRSIDHVIGRDALDFVAPDYRLEIKKIYEKIFDSGNPVKFESKSITPSGKTLYYSMTAAPIKDDGYVTAAILLAKDITILKQTEYERNKLSDRYRLLLEKSGCPITLIDLEGKIVLINEVGANNLQGEPHDFVGKSIYKILPAFADEQKKRIDVICQTGKGLIREDKISLPSGDQWFLTYLQPVKEDNEIVAIQIFSIDITIQKNSELRIRETKEYLNNVIDNINEIIFTINKDKKISLWNESAHRITSYSSKKVIKKSIFDLDFILNPEEINNYIDRIFSNKKADIDTILIRGYDGSSRYFTPSISVLKDEENNVSDIVFICNDVTFELDVYKNLIKGSSYLIIDDEMTIISKILYMLRLEKKNELVITREPYDHHYIDSQKFSADVRTFSSIKDKKNKSIHTPEDLKTVVFDFLEKQKNTVIFIDRIDYLIHNFGMPAVIPILYEINDMVRRYDAILLLKINKDLINEIEYLFFQEEYRKLPSYQISNVYLTDNEFEILHYIYDENQSNRIVKQINIVKHCSISKVTAHKKIAELIKKSLVYSKPIGRSKQLYVTKLGKDMIRK